MKWFNQRKLPSIGLVLDGGGGRGPYQIGVYLAMKKYGLTDKVIGISGSSVGAFMSVIFLYDEPRKIIGFWKKIDNDIIIQAKDHKVSAFTKALMNKDGIFSRENLIKLVNSNIDLKVLLENKTPVFVSLAKEVLSDKGKVASYAPKYIQINGLPSEDILTLLLATSAIPYVFDPVEYKGERYVDPMKADNEPYKPLLSFDPDMLFIVPLNVSHYTHHYDEKFPKTIVDFASPKMMGLPKMNMLDFSQNQTDLYISEGYQVGKMIIKYMKDNNLLVREDKKTKNLMPKKYISLANMNIKYIDFATMSTEDILNDVEKGDN